MGPMGRVTKRHTAVLELFRALTTMHVGDRISRREVQKLTGWSDGSLDTYVSKNKLSPFMKYVSSTETFVVVEEGSNVSMDDFLSSFTQANPRVYKPSPGSELTSLTGSVYLLEEPIGNGAVATVWRCALGDSETKYAAKILQPRRDILESDRLPNVIRRFLQEAKNSRKLACPHIVKSLDLGYFSGDKSRPFLIMELASESVGSRLRREGTLPLRAVSQTLLACAKGLVYLHKTRCIHRDIKPENILIMPDGRIALGDLGVVRWDDLNPAFTKAGTLTREAVTLGSLLYMAPEQQEQARDAVDASDIYSLGVTAIEMLTGTVPPAAYIGAGRYPPPSSNAQFNDFLKRMLDCEPSSRPTASEVQTFLEGVE